MGNVTPVQKATLLKLARLYDERVCNILRGGDDDMIVIRNDQDAAVLESFSDVVVKHVGDTYPDHEGKDSDINDDAQMCVVIVSRAISRYRLSLG